MVSEIQIACRGLRRSRMFTLAAIITPAGNRNEHHDVFRRQRRTFPDLDLLMVTGKLKPGVSLAAGRLLGGIPDGCATVLQ